MAEKYWYVVHVFTGYEKRVKAFIYEELKKHPELQDKVEEIIIPERKLEVRKKDGSTQSRKKKIVPGYVLIKMEDDENLMRLLISIPRIMGFLGSRTPRKISDAEAEEMMAIMEKVEMQGGIPYIKGQQIRIIDGPFTDFTGVVEKVDREKERLTVMITIFGRSTPVELSFYQIQPV